MRDTRILIPVLVAMTAALAACGGDDSVTSGSSPCLDEHTTCVSLVATPQDMTFASINDASYDIYQRRLTWQRPATFQDFRPGQKIRLFIKFYPPLVVVYDHTEMYLALGMRKGTGGIFNSFAHPATTVDVDGSMSVTIATVEILGNSSTADMQCNVSVIFDHPVAGQELEGLRMTFTVPDTYTSGGGTGNPIPAADLQVDGFVVASDLAAPEDGPAIWPKGEPLP